MSHEAAKRLARNLRCPIVTTEFVLVEVANFLSTTPAKLKLGPFLDSLRADRHTQIVPATSELLDRGLQLYLDRPDKTWSVTDGISFVVMQDEHMDRALTADHDFEQAGFNALLTKTS